MAKIRVLVVEDSITMRKCLVDVLKADPEIEVVGEAEDGDRATELCYTLRPDVITLDMMMPHMTGVEATEQIMAYCPTPILIVSSSVNRTELFKTYDALAAGAVDVMEKPKADEVNDAWNHKLISTVKLVSRIKVITHLRAKLSSNGKTYTHLSKEPSLSFRSGSKSKSCVCIGTSTGGPKALVEILGGLPKHFPLPVFIVIHIGHPFDIAFAEWLNSESPIPIRYAVDGEPFPNIGDSRAILAPPDRHLILSEGRIRLTQTPERHSCRPSVDVFFESVACELGPKSIACLLTGMGRDGAEGLLAIRKAGGITLVQDEATSIVFGMPREAILLGAAGRVLPLNEIAPTLLSIVAEEIKEVGGSL